VTVSAAAAGEWRLGDVTVRRLGLGTKRLSQGRDHAIAVLRRAVELGVNHIDTASFYPNDAPPGLANELIRQALWPYPDDLLIATKVGPTVDGLARTDQLRGLVEANLRELGCDQLGLVNLRQFGLDSVAEHFAELARLQAEGLIRHLGLSNVRPEHLAQAQEIASVVCVQNRYAVDFGRVNDDLLRTCGDQGVAFVPFFALTGEGREAGRLADTEAVRQIALAHDATAAQVRLAWILQRGPHVLAIPGTSKVEHLVENVGAAALRLSAEDLARLE
jgi:aryl-alcohol dehydrogenase-like predicted oxidoreductase